MRKILFLDIDGVCNSEEFVMSPRNPKIGGMIGIDPFAAVLVKMIVQDTGCEVVLSSTWRLHKDGRDDVREQVVDFVDVTPDLWPKCRGEEIENWLINNTKEDTVYAILDDDMDMLAYQASHFFKTRWKEGLTREIAKSVTDYLDAPHEEMHPQRLVELNSKSTTYEEKQWLMEILSVSKSERLK